MARKLRIQYPGALYHIFNRGNYRRDVFETVGAAQAFVATLAEACDRHGWRIHAYVVMRNHYHLAMETPQGNLADGMHWLQGTFASRFNRFRVEHGHLFQGRYQAPLVEDTAALFRVVNYINLNPVRAGIVGPSAVATFRWGSLIRFVKGPRAPWLVADTVLAQFAVEDTPAGWNQYLAYLADLACDPKMQEQQEFHRLSRGWAIGTAGWRRTLAKEYAARTLAPGVEREQLRELNEARWREELQRVLAERGFSSTDLVANGQSMAWKIAVAAELRHRVAAPYGWIANALKIDRPANMRSQVHRCSLRVSP